MSLRLCGASLLGLTAALSAHGPHMLFDRSLQNDGVPEPLSEGSYCVELPPVTVNGNLHHGASVWSESMLQSAGLKSKVKSGDKVRLSLHQKSACASTATFKFRGGTGGSGYFPFALNHGDVDVSFDGTMVNMNHSEIFLSVSPMEDCSIDISSVTICQTVLPPPPSSPPSAPPPSLPPKPPPSDPPPSPPPHTPPPSHPPKPPPSSPPLSPPPSPPPPPLPPPPPCKDNVDEVHIVGQDEAWKATCTCPNGEVYEVGGQSQSDCETNSCQGGMTGICQSKLHSPPEFRRVTCGECPVS